MRAEKIPAGHVSSDALCSSMPATKVAISDGWRFTTRAPAVLGLSTMADTRRVVRGRRWWRAWSTTSKRSKTVRPDARRAKLEALKTQPVEVRKPAGRYITWSLDTIDGEVAKADWAAPMIRRFDESLCGINEEATRSRAYSGRSRSLIPLEADQRFQSNPITDSGRCRSPLNG